jgi:hypothetical protein
VNGRGFRLLLRPFASLDVRGHGKLGPKFYGPFKVIECIGDVVYKLQLLVGAKLHDVFRVGLMKKFSGIPLISSGSLPPIHHGQVCSEPAEVVRGRLARGHRELLMRWTSQAGTYASWVEIDEFKQLYPSFKFAYELTF